MNGLLGTVVVPAGNENQAPGLPQALGVNGGSNTICVDGLLSSSISVRPAALAVHGALKGPASPPLLVELLFDVLPELLEPPSPPLLEVLALLEPPLLVEFPLLLELLPPGPPFDESEHAEPKPSAPVHTTAASAALRLLDMRVDLSNR